MRPKSADIRAHAGPGDYVHFDAVFFQHLNDTDVREALGRAG
jgi:hypothetical protein